MTRPCSKRHVLTCLLPVAPIPPSDVTVKYMSHTRTSKHIYTHHFLHCHILAKKKSCPDLRSNPHKAEVPPSSICYHTLFTNNYTYINVSEHLMNTSLNTEQIGTETELKYGSFQVFMAIVHYLMVFSWVSEPYGRCVYQYSSKMLEHTSTTRCRKPREDHQLMNYNVSTGNITHVMWVIAQNSRSLIFLFQQTIIHLLFHHHSPNITFNFCMNFVCLKNSTSIQYILNKNYCNYQYQSLLAAYSVMFMRTAAI